MVAAFPSSLFDIILLHLLTIMYSTNIIAVSYSSLSSLLSLSSPPLLIYHLRLHHLVLLSSYHLLRCHHLLHVSFQDQNSASKNILRRRVICYRLVNWCSGSNAVTSPPAPSTGSGSGMISGDDCCFANPIFKNYYHIL